MKRLSIIILLGALIFGAGAAQAGVLSFVDQAEVDSSRVTLADLVSRSAQVSPRLLTRLAGLDMGEAPGLRRELRLPGYKLRAALAKVKLPEGMSVLIPPQVIVTRASQKLTSQEMTDIYLKALNRRLGHRAKDVDIHSLSAARDLTLPAGKLTTRVRFVGSRFSGRIPAVIEVLVGGSRVGTARVASTVDHFGEVVVAARSLPAGYILKVEDLDLVRTNLSRVKGRYAADPANLAGMKTRTPIGVGEALSLNQLDRPLLVRRGEIVTMIIKTKTMRVTAKGKAEQSGFKDGRIKLTNLATKREVYGTIVAPGTVTVTF